MIIDIHRKKKQYSKQQPTTHLLLQLEFLVHFCFWGPALKLIKNSGVCRIGFQIILTYFTPRFHFYTLWKHQKTLSFPDIFKGYKNGKLAWNGLISSSGGTRALQCSPDKSEGFRHLGKDSFRPVYNDWGINEVSKKVGWMTWGWWYGCPLHFIIEETR